IHMVVICFFFFFSSRRRHTRFSRDWSSECALPIFTGVGDDPLGRYVRREMVRLGVSDEFVITAPELNTPITLCEMFPPDHFPLRSEERRVGKECRARGSPYHQEKQ